MAGLVAASWGSQSIAAEGKVSASYVRPAVQLTAERSYAPVKFADLNERTRYSIVNARYGGRYYAGYRYGYARPYYAYRPYYYRPYYAYRPYVYRPYYAYRPYYSGYYYGYQPYYPPAVVCYPYGGAYYW